MSKCASCTVQHKADRGNNSYREECEGIYQGPDCVDTLIRLAFDQRQELKQWRAATYKARGKKNGKV